MIKNLNNEGQVPLTKKEAFFAVYSLLLFLVGATCRLDFALVGRTTVGEMIAFSSVPILLLMQGRVPRNAHLTKVFAVLVMIMVATYLADLLNKIPTWWSLRAVARPVFMAGWVLFFVLVIRKNLNAVKYFIYGAVLAGVINFFRPSSFEVEGADNILNYTGVVFRISPLIYSVTFASVLFVYPRSRILSAFIVLFAGLTNVAFGGARSGFIAYFTIFCIILLVAFFRSQQRRRRVVITAQKPLGLACVAGLALTLVYAAYIFAAPRGYLGHEQFVKFETQRNTAFGITPWGFILGGRTQVYAAILGVVDRPILGFGSWNHAATYPYVVEAVASVGTDPKVLDLLLAGNVKMIGAGHSILFQTWVENGVVPALGYLLLYWFSCRVFLFAIRYETRLTPILIMWWVFYSWAFLFSPPGLMFRMHYGLILAIYIVYMDRQRPLGPLPLLGLAK